MFFVLWGNVVRHFPQRPLPTAQPCQQILTGRGAEQDQHAAGVGGLRCAVYRFHAAPRSFNPIEWALLTFQRRKLVTGRDPVCVLCLKPGVDADVLRIHAELVKCLRHVLDRSASPFLNQSARSVPGERTHGEPVFVDLSIYGRKFYMFRFP